ncbi:MAG: T9SS type A sorting domain-containing protein [Bacteroidetes bacterium]|nr:T9SS type A sorting domain-containing protein [Bacteroidota bacterium]
MKQFLLPCALLIFSSAFSQTPLLVEDFESYQVGDYIGATSAYWTTWSGTTGGVEDGQVSDEQANSGTQSMKIFGTLAGGPMDIYLPIGLESAYEVSYNIYVPSGSSAYMNVQELQIPGTLWAFDMVFSGNGSIQLSIDQVDIAFGSYNQDEWTSVSLRMDPLNDRAEVFIGGEYIANFAFDGIIGGVNFYGFGDGNSAGLYYIDDVVVVETDDVVNGIAEVSNLDVTFGPNPANDYINISCNVVNGIVRIMALNGQVVKEISSSNLISGQRIDLDLDNGIYLVEVSSNGNHTMRKLVVSH